jgi:Tfp pilus assembly major pilin PilA
MYEKQTAGYFLICFVVIAVLGILSAIAVPHVSRMIARSESDARTTEFYKIQSAVTEMLYDSICGILEPIGPTSDMGQVCTRDIYPLVLSDYMDGESLESGCSYAFAADGAVMQMMP